MPLLPPRRHWPPFTTAAQRRLLFATWEATGGIAAACRWAHVGRRTFHYWKPRFLRGGYAALEQCASRARAAEAVFFGEITTGAQQDIQQANAIARRMVTECGMSALGHIYAGEGDMVSPELAARIDEATRTLVEEA